MTELTVLDAAHAAMEAAPEDEAARLGFYERLAGCELFLMLQSNVDDDDETILPEVFELGDTRYVLVFDREERLSAFSGQATPYVALSGRTIAGMLAGQEIGLGVNLDVAPSAILLPPEAVVWLQEMLDNAPSEVEAHISQVFAPKGLPERLVTALDAKLASAMGLAPAAYLVGVSYENGNKGHLLGFIDALPAATPALARAAAEALTFSGIEAGAMDVAFFRSGEAITERLARVGLRFDLPALQETVTQDRQPPGTDPEKPPILK